MYTIHASMHIYTIDKLKAYLKYIQVSDRAMIRCFVSRRMRSHHAHAYVMDILLDSKHR